MKIRWVYFFLIIYTYQLSWGLACEDIFNEKRPVSNLEQSKTILLKYKATEDEIALLYQQYPNIKKQVQRINKKLASKKLFSNWLQKQVFQSRKPIKIKSLEQLVDSSRGAERTFLKKEVVENIPADIKAEIVRIYNHMSDSKALAKYIVGLIHDSAVYMMKNPDMLTYELQDMKNPSSPKTSKKITKHEFLQHGIIDHHSLATVLVNRVRSRGDQIAFIHPKGVRNNPTKTQNYKYFYDVIARGPFFDKEFDRATKHGQEFHLMQMDYVESVLTDRKNFWSYLNQSPWLWEVLFDNYNKSIMHPEFAGPNLVRPYIPLY